MTGLGQRRTCRPQIAMSVLPLKRTSHGAISMSATLSIRAQLECPLWAISRHITCPSEENVTTLILVKKERAFACRRRQPRSVRTPDFLSIAERGRLVRPRRHLIPGSATQSKPSPTRPPLLHWELAGCSAECADRWDPRSRRDCGCLS